MSNSSLFSRRTASPPTVPRGDVLGEYESYLEAQKIVDRLAKADFAVSGMAIVGSNLTTVERITGRLTYGRAALTGAASGSWIGLFFGLLLFLFSPAPEFSFIIAAALIGAGFGMIFGIVSYAVNRRRRDFSSTHQVLASTYRIIIDPNQTARARRALEGGSAWPPPLLTDAPSAPSAPSTTSEPRADQSRADQPRADQPGADQPRVDQPRADQPRVDQPRVDQPRVDQPRVDQPRVDQPADR